MLRYYAMHLPRRFLLTTSIRGARRTLASKERPLRIFWAVYILLSIFCVLAASFYCIQSYVSFDTMVQRQRRPLGRADFPSVTLCSDAFFSLTRDAFLLLPHPLAYKRVLNAMGRAAFKAGLYGRLHTLMGMKDTVMYNINNAQLLEPLFKSFVEWHNNTEFANVTAQVRDPLCRVYSRKRIYECEILPHYDLRFRNCFSFQIPFRDADDPVHKMELVLPSTALHPSVVFAADQLHVKPLLGNFIFFFLHEHGTLPAMMPTLFIPSNNYQSALVHFDTRLEMDLSTPRSHCHSNPPMVRHAGGNVMLDRGVCASAKLRETIFRRCRCLTWKPPISDWPMKKERMCGSLQGRQVSSVVKEMECMWDQEARMASEGNSDTCRPRCSRRRYENARVFDLQMSKRDFRLMMNDFRLYNYSQRLKHHCNKTDRLSQLRCHSIVPLVANLLGQVSEADDEPPGQSGGSWLEMSEAKRRATAEWLKPNEKDNQSIWWKAYPHYVRFNLSALLNYSLTYHHLVVRPRRPFAYLDKESLVRTKWITLGQVGGAASFLAGLSFTVLAEIVDACYHVCKRRREEQRPRNEDPDGEEEEEDEKKEELHSLYWSSKENSANI